MNFTKHLGLEGVHAPFSPSQPSWLRYDDKKLVEAYSAKKATEMGTLYHAWAKQTIDLRIRQPRSNKTLYAYVNDAIGYKMSTEVLLYYSNECFGTADAISFNHNVLRIHDLKTGKIPAHMEQLKIYAALFCLEYNYKPSTIEIELRIYQNDDIQVCRPEADEISDIMTKIEHIHLVVNALDRG